MLPNRNSKPFSCISCGSTFKRNGDLASHLTQATKCHWVIENCEQIQAAEMPDFRELSDHEDDPPAEPELLVPYESMDIFADDIFDEQPDERPSLDDMDQPTSSATNGSDQQVRVKNVSDDEDHEFHDNDGHARIEDELDQDYIFFKTFLAPERFIAQPGMFIRLIQRKIVTRINPSTHLQVNWTGRSHAGPMKMGLASPCLHGY
jgi:hypothetical protein